jgi:poly(3-hydroxybutyrate) depolymerase
MSVRHVLGGFVFCAAVVAFAGCTVGDEPDMAAPPGATAGASTQAGSAGTGTAGASTTPGAGMSGVIPGGGTSGVIPGGGSATGGATAGGTATGGTSVGGSATGGSGSTPGGPYTVPRGMSAGCGKQNGTDEPGKYTSHDIEVTGVDPYWLTEKKPYAGQAPYTFTHRAFAIRLPTGYDPSKPYPLVFQGGGCGNTDGTSGKTGGDKLIPDSAIGEGIAVGLSYVYPDGAGACFADDGANTYEIPYWDAVYKQITDNYCVNLEKVFAGGYSSGAWMAYTTAFARGGKVRGMGAGAGGIREKRPPASNIPFAAMLITGEDDGANPVHKTKDGTTCAGTEAEGCWKGKIICGFPGADTCYDTGSAHARDEILKRNGCVGTATTQYDKWPDCHQYMGCPAAFPVVYCMPAGGHTGGDDRHTPGIWDFWKKLPAVP